MSEGVFARTYGVQILCAEAPTISKQALLQRLAQTCPGVQPLGAGDDHVLAFIHPDHPVQLADATLRAQTFVAASDGPPDVDRMQPALAQTWDFEGAQAAMATAKSAVLVTDIMTSSLDHRPRLDLVHGAIRAVLDLVPAIAIHWPHAERIVDPRAWLESFNEGPASRFFAGAVNVRMFNVQDDPGTGEKLMDTMGLGALGLPDLQCHFRNLEPGAVARMLYNLAWYLFQNGDVIEDGHTVPGLAPGSKWKCQHEDALAGPGRLVLDIDPGPPYAAGGRGAARPPS